MELISDENAQQAISRILCETGNPTDSVIEIFFEGVSNYIIYTGLNP